MPCHTNTTNEFNLKEDQETEFPVYKQYIQE